jgi:hypothetical protein
MGEETNETNLNISKLPVDDQKRGNRGDIERSGGFGGDSLDVPPILKKEEQAHKDLDEVTPDPNRFSKN